MTKRVNTDWKAAVVVAMVMLVISQAAPAQSFATHPMRLLLTNPPGGTVDTLARVLADGFSHAFGQPVVIENRPGANGGLAAEAMAATAPDGHTLLLGPPGPIAINRLLYQKMSYDPRTAFAPVSLVAVAPLVLVVNPGLPAQSLRELIDLARARPGAISYASQGGGSSGHLAMEMLASAVRIELTHVPYKGSAPALTDLIAGHVQVMFDNTTSSLPHVRRGSLRALAVAERTRIKAAPDIPTVAESGVADFEATPWFGLVARTGTPQAVIDQIAAEVSRILARPDVEARFTALGVDLRGLPAAPFAAYIASETAKWERIIKAASIRLD